MEDGIDTIVLDDELAYIDVVPLRWVPLTEPLDPERAAANIDQNLRLLQAFAALEDHGSVEKPDENGPHAADLLRIEFKVNLLLDLVGQVIAGSQQRPAPMAMRFNAHGAVWQARDATALQPGMSGVLELFLREALVQPLRLAGRIVSVGADRRVKVKFEATGEPVADLIEKLAFRRHRRQVAGHRHPRR